jgi:DNA invertase Pin-like site-specific DNA recombinase
MIDDAKKGYIGTIIVKDLSRFGRDYIGMGDYLEQILPSLNVRLIAINSRYDSAEQGANIVNLDVSISNMINNMYTGHIQKDQEFLRCKVESGNQRIGLSPYGYVVRRDDPTHTPIIDEEAAAVVREIFNLRLPAVAARHCGTPECEKGLDTNAIQPSEVR